MPSPADGGGHPPDAARVDMLFPGERRLFIRPPHPARHSPDPVRLEAQRGAQPLPGRRAREDHGGPVWLEDPERFDRYPITSDRDLAEGLVKLAHVPPTTGRAQLTRDRR